MACTDPDAIRAAEITGHTKYLDHLDPDSPHYDLRFRPIVAAIARGGKLSPRARHVPLTKSWTARINVCLYRECRAGCQRSLCHAGRGDSWGQVTMEDCRRCLRRGDAPDATDQDFKPPSP